MDISNSDRADMFAAFAMHALIVHGEGQPHQTTEEMANEAYRIAALMLAARENTRFKG